MTEDALLSVAQVAPKARKPATTSTEPAASRPIAHVAVDTPLPHLDRPFDYLVPATMDEAAVPGCRVRVRFAGKLVDGYLLGRADETDHQGRLAWLYRVVSPEPVLSDEIAGLARIVADRYAGTLADVLRLAIPPRHARVEGEASPHAQEVPAFPVPGPWAVYPAGGSFLRALADGKAPRAVWTALPGVDHSGPSWPRAIALAVQAVLAGGRGAVVVLPDGKDVALADAALTEALGDGRHVALTADLGPAERYRRWLKAARGAVHAVVGTRAAMFAPVRNIGLTVIWDDGDDVHAEPHAPYPHAREALALRAHRVRAGMLIGGYARSAEATQLIATGWARSLTPERDTVRRSAPNVRPAGEDRDLARDEAARQARLPTLAWRTAKQALESGPVLVQVPRRGYFPAVACQNCRAPARCAECSGHLALRDGHAAPYCHWCGRIAGTWRCPACQHGRLRAIVVGARRTAEELGRAFPSVSVLTSGRDGVLPSVDATPALIVATPGAEPVPEGGYAAALLLDGWALLGRADLRAGEEALRRWLNAAALVRPGGDVVVLGDSALPTVQALLRWDPVTHAERELADRAELGFPPVVRIATLSGSPEGIADMLAQATLPPVAEVLGPVQVDAGERVLIRVPRGEGAALARSLKGAAGVRSARKAADLVRVRIDPLELI